MGHQIILGNLGLQRSTAISRWVGGWVAKKSLDLVVSNLTAPVRVLLLLEDERVAGEVGRCDEVDLDQHCNYNKYLHFHFIWGLHNFMMIFFAGLVCKVCLYPVLGDITQANNCHGRGAKVCCLLCFHSLFNQSDSDVTTSERSLLSVINPSKSPLNHYTPGIGSGALSFRDDVWFCCS